MWTVISRMWENNTIARCAITFVIQLIAKCAPSSPKDRISTRALSSPNFFNSATYSICMHFHKLNWEPNETHPSEFIPTYKLRQRSWALNIVAIIPKRVFFYCNYQHDSDVATPHTDGQIQVSTIRVKVSKCLCEVSETLQWTNT